MSPSAHSLLVAERGLAPSWPPGPPPSRGLLRAARRGAAGFSTAYVKRDAVTGMGLP